MIQVKLEKKTMTAKRSVYGFVALSLATNFVNITAYSSFASDFPKGKFEAMNYTPC